MLHIHKKFQLNRTKIKGGCQLETKAAHYYFCTDLTLPTGSVWLYLAWHGLHCPGPACSVPARHNLTQHIIRCSVICSFICLESRNFRKEIRRNMYIGSLGVPQNLVFKYEHFFVSPQLKNLFHFDNLQIRKKLKFPITFNFISKYIGI